jgi:hypothetical protein
MPISNLPQFLCYREVVGMDMIPLSSSSIPTLQIEDSTYDCGDLEGCSEQQNGDPKGQEILI